MGKCICNILQELKRICIWRIHQKARTSQKRNAQVKKPVRINSKKRRRRRIIKRIVIAVIVVLLAGAGIYAGPKLVKIAKLAARCKADGR